MVKEKNIKNKKESAGIKAPPLLRAGHGGRYEIDILFPATRAFGGLQRVYLCLSGHFSSLDMCRHVTDTVFPLQRRFRKSAAVPTGLELNNTGTSLACFNSFYAGAAVVGTSLCSHERAVIPFSYSGADHLLISPYVLGLQEKPEVFNFRLFFRNLIR
ncbi:hypothetical protein [Desulfococcus sp.]|jgi:hypothetical protein|uniref:hypothetical protein n=1 Tax=Desulfococcus sp. TaxID=2025834 RepID=UPI003D141CEC